MFIEKFLGKVEKALGGDALETRWYELPLYEFVLEKEVSEVRVEGHGWEWREGDVVVYKANNSGWARATVYPLSGEDEAMKAVFGGDGFNEVKRVSGVEEVSEEKVGTTEWDIMVDVAEGTIVDVEQETIRDFVA